MSGKRSTWLTVKVFGFGTVFSHRAAQIPSCILASFPIHGSSLCPSRLCLPWLLRNAVFYIKGPVFVYAQAQGGLGCGKGHRQTWLCWILWREADGWDRVTGSAIPMIGLPLGFSILTVSARVSNVA